MKFDDNAKQSVLGQIDDFNNQPSNPSLTNSDPYAKAYLYVNSSDAKTASAFLAYLLKENKVTLPETVAAVDLCFGSGSLTSHLLLDNDIDVSSIVFNDQNSELTNQAITVGVISEVQSVNVLTIDLSLADDKQANLIVFNPQIGGNYNDGKLDIDVSDANAVIINDNPTAYLEQECSIQSQDITIDDTKRTITITYDKSKPRLKNVKSINYYDIILVKGEKKEALSPKLSQLRKNIDQIAADDHWVAFYGLKKNFELFFKDYNIAHQLLNGGQPSLFLASKGDVELCTCYKKDGSSFKETSCDESTQTNIDTSQSLLELGKELLGHQEALKAQLIQNPIGEKEEVTTSADKETNKANANQAYDTSKKGSLDFDIMNLLLKGVPGTGKSRLINRIIQHKLKLLPEHEASNVLRINIHSGSSNADLMQGIGISTNAKSEIEYREKQGLIFSLIMKACTLPKQPFVLVLEEIQENSLNELIGDLIYLIEPEKRTKLSDSLDVRSYAPQELIEAHLKASDNPHYVQIPNLIESGAEYRKMILPNNLYVFCTSNYRDDKKIIEDNLLRRFDVLDLFPDAETIADDKTQDFFKALNESILSVLKDEIHPDRFEIGHASWMGITFSNEEGFAKVLYKTLIELKEIREIQSSDILKILGESKNAMPQVFQDKLDTNLIDFVKHVQSIAYKDLLADFTETSQQDE